MRLHECLQVSLVTVHGHAWVAHGMRRVDLAERAAQRCNDGVPPLKDGVVETCLCTGRPEIGHRILRQSGGKQLFVSKVDSRRKSVESLNDRESVRGMER
ncbi:hypothetical protein D9M68_955620 [compost metagenome]